MINGMRHPWYTRTWFLRLLEVLGIIEVAVGAFLLSRHDQSRGVAFVVLGILTFACGPWMGRHRSQFRF